MLEQPYVAGKWFYRVPGRWSAHIRGMTAAPQKPLVSIPKPRFKVGRFHEGAPSVFPRNFRVARDISKKKRRGTRDPGTPGSLQERGCA
jgi:hypothetical protein